MSDTLARNSKVMAGEIEEAIKTLKLAMETEDEREIIEAKNTVSNVIRDYKSFSQNLSDTDVRLQKLQTALKKKVEEMVQLAKKLP